MLLLILSFRVMGSWGNGSFCLILRAALSIALWDLRIIPGGGCEHGNVVFWHDNLGAAPVVQTF